MKKYIKNNGRYDITFTITVGALEKKIKFLRRRLYKDTGNVAVLGITEVDEDDLKALEKLPEFKAYLKSGVFEEVKEDAFNPTDAKDKEIADLKAQLEKANTAEVEKELAEKDKEIADLKAQLEAKGKANKPTAEKPEDKKDETEGF